MYCNYNLHLCTKEKLRARKNYRTLFHISGQNIVTSAEFRFIRNSSNLPKNIQYCLFTVFFCSLATTLTRKQLPLFSSVLHVRSPRLSRPKSDRCMQSCKNCRISFGGWRFDEKTGGFQKRMKLDAVDFNLGCFALRPWQPESILIFMKESRV